MKRPMQVNERWWLVLILLLGITLRLRNFWLPPIDAHAMRQTDTECVAYFLAKDGQWQYPKSCLLRPAKNTSGYFFLEFPAYQGLIAIGYRLVSPTVAVPRLLNLGLYILMTINIYKLAARLLKPKYGLAAALLISLVPGGIFFLGHAVHPDVFALATMAAGFNMYLTYKQTGAVAALAGSGLLLGLSGATRPFGLIVLPALYWVMKTKRAGWREYVWITVASLGVYGLWRVWAEMAGADITWENWVLSGREKMFDLGLVKNLVWKNVAGEIVGKTASGLALIGAGAALIRKDKRLTAFWIWLAMVPVYWFLVPNGNLTHQYYANIYVIPVVVMASLGLVWMGEKSKMLGGLAVMLLVVNGWRTSGYFFNNINMENIDIAREIAENVPEGEKALYLYRANSVPLSLAHRQGWIMGEWPTDVGSYAWSVVEMRNKADFVVLPKSGYPGVEGEELKVVLENLELVTEGIKTKTYRFK